jgi:chemotaxis signal transduction protein
LRSGTLACPQATQVLTYINSLYTVYTTLFLFDREGRVIAVSNPDQAHHVGRILQEDWVAETLKLNTQDDYAVSPFTSNPFSGESATFVYAAAVRDTEYKNTPVIGGIGIVWDGASQLASILTDCAGQASSENLLAFVDANGHLVASQGNAQLLPDPQAVAYCQRDGRIVELAGALYSVGVHSGYGYREFRLRDGYAHGLSCIVLKNLCQSQSCATVTRAHRSGGQTHQVEAGHGLQMASFVVDGHWLGLPAAQVVLAAEDAEIISTSRAHPPFAGMTMIGGKVYPVIDMRSVIKRSAHAATNRFTVASESESARQMIVVRVSTTADSTHDLVLRVDTLGEVLEVDTRKVQDMNMIKAESSYGLIDAVMPVSGSKDHQANDHALLCRLSNLWLQQSVEAALQDLIPADLACFKDSALTH